MNEAPSNSVLADGSSDPWIESREGMLFFANALLVFPQISVFFPLLLGGALRFLGVSAGLQEILEVIPALAAWALPLAGFGFLLPLWFALRTRERTVNAWARGFLLVFAAAHASFVFYATWHWVMRGTTA